MRRALWTTALLVTACVRAPQPTPTPNVPAPPGPEAGARHGAVPSAPPRTGDVTAQPSPSPDAELADAEEPLEDAAGVDDSDDSPEQGLLPAAPHPLAHLSDEELRQRLASDPKSLGSLSIGSPSAGLLVNGIQLPERPYWRCMMPEEEWGTAETLAYLDAAFTAFLRRHPGCAPLPIGDLSAPKGGPLSPHKSHQSGRDVDLGLFYTDDSQWYGRARATNFDVERNWDLVRAFLTETDVEMIFLDQSLIALLQAHAKALGEDPAWLQAVFKGSARRGPILRHARGHATHFHVRFFNPMAQSAAERAWKLLVDLGQLPPPVYYVEVVAKKGDSLGKLSKRHGVSVQELRRANHLRSNLIIAGLSYRVPKQGVRPVRAMIAPRLLPPKDPRPPVATAGTGVAVAPPQPPAGPTP